jgi:hypothetical protein
VYFVSDFESCFSGNAKLYIEERDSSVGVLYNISNVIEFSEFFLATESLSQPVTVVPSGNAPTRVSPSLTLAPKKIHR